MPNRQGREGIEGSSGESSTTTIENDKSPKGPLAGFLALEIIPPPQSETITVESGDSEDHHRPAGEEGQGAQARGGPRRRGDGNGGRRRNHR